MKIRLQTESDTNFIYHSWLRSYRNRADVIPYHWYYKVYQSVLDRLLKRAPAQVAVACHPEYPDQIFGFIAYEHTADTPTIHYCYVKEPYRGNGVAKGLLLFALQGNETFTYTFAPTNHSRVKKLGGRYNPKQIRIPLPDVVHSSQGSEVPVNHDAPQVGAAP